MINSRGYLQLSYLPLSLGWRPLPPLASTGKFWLLFADRSSAMHDMWAVRLHNTHAMSGNGETAIDGGFPESYSSEPRSAFLAPGDGSGTLGGS